MKRPRSRRVVLARLCALPLLASPAFAAAATTELHTLRLGTAEAATSPLSLAAVRFAEGVARRSNGRLKVEVYPNGQLGKQQETIDGLATGVIDLSLSAASALEPLFPRYQVFSAPFLFKDAAAALRVLDGPVGAELAGELASKGLLALGWAAGGFKEIETTSKAIVVPADLRGMRIRILSGTFYLAMYQTLGAIPLILDVAETYTALSAHTIDGMDQPVAAFATQKFYTICKQVSMTNHGVPAQVLLASARKLAALPRPLSNIVKDEARAVLPYWRSQIARENVAGIATLKGNGITLTEPDRAAFRKAVEPVYAMMQAKIGGDLLERVIRFANP